MKPRQRVEVRVVEGARPGLNLVIMKNLTTGLIRYKWMCQEKVEPVREVKKGD